MTTADLQIHPHDNSTNSICWWKLCDMIESKCEVNRNILGSRIWECDLKSMDRFPYYYFQGQDWTCLYRIWGKDIFASKQIKPNSNSIRGPCKLSYCCALLPCAWCNKDIDASLLTSSFFLIAYKSRGRPLMVIDRSSNSSLHNIHVARAGV